ncbi:hypothetical protein [Nocardioides convexus]|uniref:hypothetical protein n=1 Tax=Nocardioides convexus TaxID=2712224 RepID=UPI0024187397|nr:hypothetical protein [Nocardioides convexus]
MLLREPVDTSTAVAATRSRKEKVRLIAALLSSAEPVERALVAHFLSGRLRQRRTGLGYRSLTALPPPAQDASLSVVEVDAAFAAMAALSGPGSAGARALAVVGSSGGPPRRSRRGCARSRSARCARARWRR